MIDLSLQAPVTEKTILQCLLCHPERQPSFCIKAGEAGVDLAMIETCEQ
jgi:hypothetical protein